MKNQFIKKQIVLIGICFLSIYFISFRSVAQSPCMATVPSFTINMTGNSAGVWSSPNISRNDQCCSISPPDQCVYFYLTLDPNAAGIQIDMIGADPAGSLFYSINCTGSYPGGTIKCITGVGPHKITFCKPGSNKNIYKITSISKPLFPKDDTVRLGCKHKLITLGIVNNSVTWQSIYPGTLGQYNSYLDSTNVASPTYSPASGAPPYIDYKVCGFPQASGCGFSLTVCDTVRIYNYPKLTGTVTPNPATYCNIGGGSGVTLTGSAGGGLPTYSYTWKNSSNVIVGTGSTYFANASGTYTLEVKDALYDPANCPAVFKSVSVSEGTVPVVDAGNNRKVCSSNPVSTLSGSVQYASGGIWSGGTGTFTPGNTFLNTSYYPTPAEITAGFVKLYLTSSGAGGGCVNKKDSVIIYYTTPVSVTIPPATVACHNGTTTLTALVSGGTAPYTYNWSTGSNNSSINVGQGNYSILVSDSLGCTGTNNYNVVVPSALGISFNVSNVTFNGGNDGSATVTASGGTPAYSVTWTPGGSNSFTLANLTYGVYTATITDANGCKIAGSTIVNEPRCLGFSAVVSGTNVTCNGFSDGSATVTPSGGTPAYTYTWNSSPVQNTANATNLKGGVYTVIIKDANSCYQTGNVVITEPTMLTDVITSTNVTSIGGNDGAATANPFGGTSPYTYLWSTSSTNASITSLIAGTYTVNITDNKGCLKVDSVKITQPPCNNLTLNVLKNNVTCFGGNNGNAIAIVGGATGSYTVSWSTGANGLFVNSLSAGNYTVGILDSKNCSQFFNFSITQPPVLSAGLLPTNVKCNGTGDGTIDLTVSGGTYPYVFSWNNGSTAEDIINLGPGTYSVNITDASGCVATAWATISEPTPLNVTYTAQNVTCIYGNNGSINLTVSGGVIPYTYTWSTGSNNQNITNVSAGGYTVNVKDANNCTLSQPLIIGVSQPDSVKVDSFIVACSVPGSGKTLVTVVPSGGYSGVYQVSFNNGGTYQSPGVYQALLNNGTTYSVVLKDGNGCNSLKTYTVGILNEVKIDSIVFAKCYTAGTLSVPVTVYPAGGDGGPFQVSFDNGSNYLGAGVYTANLSISSGYSVMVKDTRGCVSATSLITLPSVFSTTASATSNYNGQNISCFGLTDGSASVTVSGGTGPYTYSWSPSSQTTTAASNLGAGTYSVTVKDIFNCSVTSTVNLIQPVVLTSTITALSNYNGQNISCNGVSDGSATVTHSGGTGPYTYAWSSSQTTSVVTGMSAGFYTVTVKDVNNCSSVSTVTLTQPTPINATVAVVSNYNGKDISCFGASDGSASVTVIGGTGAYTYTWNSSPTQTTSLASNLTAGAYNVTIQDVNGCTAIYSITLTQPALLVSTAAITSNYNGEDISCFGLSDGSASVTVNGGTGPFTYTWTTSPTQTTSTASNLSAGNYTVNVTDKNGCTSKAVIIVAQPTQLLASLTSTSNYNGYAVSCFGSNNGFVNSSVTGGTGVYTYSWSNSASTANINNLTAGSYTLIVTDVNGCKDTLSVNLTQPNKLLITIDSLTNYNGYNVRCKGSVDGGVYVTVTGGVINYTYSWSNGGTSEDNTGIGAGNYILTVTDKNGCFVTRDTTLIEPPAFSFSSVVKEPLCNAVTNGSINITVGGGVSPYTYNWSNGATTEDLNSIGSGTYSVVYMDKNNCKDSVQIIVKQPLLLVVVKDVVAIKCHNDSSGSISLNVYGGTTPYTYAWSNAQTGKTITNLKAGSYIVKVTDANGCFYNDTIPLAQPDSLIIGLQSPLQFDGYNISYPGGEDGSINLSVNGGTSPYTYLWSNSSSLKDQNNLRAGFYEVTVIDINGCRVTGSIILTEPLILEMPSGFSPNKDGKNDLFVVHGIEAYPDNKITIYNRWGNIVYDKSGYQNDWQGYSNNGLELPDATYFVLLEINGGEKVLKGFVELRR